MNKIYTEYDEIALGYNTIWPNLAHGDHVWNNPPILFFPIPHFI